MTKMSLSKRRQEIFFKKIPLFNAPTRERLPFPAILGA